MSSNTASMVAPPSRVADWVTLAKIRVKTLVVATTAGSLFALMTTGAVEGFRESFPGYQERFVLLSEQFARPVLPMIHRGYVIENGMLTLSGTGAELMDNPEIKAAYFGI